MAKRRKELVEEEIGEPVDVEVKQPLEKIVPIRLSADHWAELYRYAHELGIGPTTLARMWILEKLSLIRAAVPAAYASRVAYMFPSQIAPAPLRITLDQFKEALVPGLTDDTKKSILEFAKESVIPPDAEKVEDMKALFMTRASANALEKPVLQAIAKLMGVEIVEEEAKVEEPKV